MRTFFFIVFGTLMVGGALTVLNRFLPDALFGYPYDRSYIHGVPLSLEIADTREARIQGLSGRSALPDGSGMLFVFPEDGMHGIWMKDMNFAIDILWLDAEYKIVFVKHVVTPETYPESFYADVPSRYVLELPAGFAREHDFKIGDKLMRSSLQRPNRFLTFFDFLK